MARTDYARTLVNSDPSNALQIVELQTGWPSIVRLSRQDQSTTVFSVHMSAVSTHARADHEFRFQNPATRNVVCSADGIPVLIGVYQPDIHLPPIFVGVDGHSRVDRSARFSILFDKRILIEAAATGWATYTSSRGEQVTAFGGHLAVAYLESVSGAGGAIDVLRGTVRDIGVAVKEELQEADSNGVIPTERVRIVATRIARSSQFSRRVLQADNNVCVLCGIKGPFLQAAHILPVTSPGSNDNVSNGMTLCANHHILFDAHHLFIAPNNFTVMVSPQLQDLAAENNPLHTLIQDLPERVPNRVGNAPQFSTEMLQRRRDLFEDHYHWVD